MRFSRTAFAFALSAVSVAVTASAGNVTCHQPGHHHYRILCHKRGYDGLQLGQYHHQRGYHHPFENLDSRSHLLPQSDRRNLSCRHLGSQRNRSEPAGREQFWQPFHRCGWNNSGGGNAAGHLHQCQLQPLRGLRQRSHRGHEHHRHGQLYFRCRSADSHAHSDSNTHANSNSDADSNTHSDSDSDRDAHSNTGARGNTRASQPDASAHGTRRTPGIPPVEQVAGQPQSSVNYPSLHSLTTMFDK